MSFNFFLMPLAQSFLISTVLLLLFVLAGKKYFAFDVRRAQRHHHEENVSRFGGVAIILAFISSLLLDGRLFLSWQLKGVLLCCMLILVYGLIDDFKQLGWKTQIIFQLSIVLLAYAFGIKLEYVTNPLGGIFFFESGIFYALGLLISIAWVIFLMNAMNWIDGVDGAVGGMAMIAAATIFLISQRPEVNQPPIGIITAALIGSFAAFLFFNFHPAKIMAGTSGSMFIGFILAILAIFAGAKIATTLMVLALPIIDALWVMGERARQGKSIFMPDKRHLHFRLMQLGWSVKKICFFYYMLTIAIAALALNMRVVGKTATLIIILVAMLSLLFVVSEKVENLENI